VVSCISNAWWLRGDCLRRYGPDLLEAEIAGTQAMTDRPFGVNLIHHASQLDDLVRRVSGRQGQPIFVLAGASHRAGAVGAVKDGGRQA